MFLTPARRDNAKIGDVRKCVKNDPILSDEVNNWGKYFCGEYKQTKYE